MADDTGDDPPLPADIPSEPAVNSANILSASLSDSLFKLHGPVTSRKVSRDSQYTISFSQHAITTSSGKTLYSIPVHPSDVRSLLQHAIQFGNAQDVNAFTSSFKSSANGLTLIMNAIASSPGKPTFNWAAYADVARILLDNTKTTGNEASGSWVGVVKNPSGVFVAELGIIPELIVVPGAPQQSPPPKPASRLIKRDTYAIPGTSYRLVVAKGDQHLPGRTLAILAKYVLDSVVLDPIFEGYRALLTNDQFHDVWGSNAFSLVASAGLVIDYNEMLDIARAIFALVDTYSSRTTAVGHRYRAIVRNLQGQIIGATGALIATWSIGGVPPHQLAAAAVCPTVVVAQPDGSMALGCVRT